MPSIKQPDYNTIIDVARKRKASKYLDKKIAEGLKLKPYIKELTNNE